MLLRALATADVVALTFPRLQCTLVADLRPLGDDRPALFVSPVPLLTAARALEALAAHRPGLAAIERYAQATWGGSTQAFAEQGILPALLDRLSVEAGREAMAVFEELRAVERGPTARETHAKV
jgi:hypothetical protein